MSMMLPGALFNPYRFSLQKNKSAELKFEGGKHSKKPEGSGNGSESGDDFSRSLLQRGASAAQRGITTSTANVARGAEKIVMDARASLALERLYEDCLAVARGDKPLNRLNDETYNRLAGTGNYRSGTAYKQSEQALDALAKAKRETDPEGYEMLAAVYYAVNVHAMLTQKENIFQAIQRDKHCLDVLGQKMYWTFGQMQWGLPAVDVEGYNPDRDFAMHAQQGYFVHPVESKNPDAPVYEQAWRRNPDNNYFVISWHPQRGYQELRITPEDVRSLQQLLDGEFAKSPEGFLSINADKPNQFMSSKQKVTLAPLREFVGNLPLSLKAQVDKLPGVGVRQRLAEIHAEPQLAESTPINELLKHLPGVADWLEQISARTPVQFEGVMAQLEEMDPYAREQLMARMEEVSSDEKWTLLEQSKSEGHYARRAQIVDKLESARPREQAAILAKLSEAELLWKCAVMPENAWQADATLDATVSSTLPRTLRERICKLIITNTVEIRDKSGRKIEYPLDQVDMATFGPVDPAVTKKTALQTIQEVFLPRVLGKAEQVRSGELPLRELVNDNFSHWIVHRLAMNVDLAATYGLTEEESLTCRLAVAAETLQYKESVAWNNKEKSHYNGQLFDLNRCRPQLTRINNGDIRPEDVYSGFLQQKVKWDPQDNYDSQRFLITYVSEDSATGDIRYDEELPLVLTKQELEENLAILEQMALSGSARVRQIAPDRVNEYVSFNIQILRHMINGMNLAEEAGVPVALAEAYLQRKAEHESNYSIDAARMTDWQAKADAAFTRWKEQQERSARSEDVADRLAQSPKGWGLQRFPGPGEVIEGGLEDDDNDGFGFFGRAVGGE